MLHRLYLSQDGREESLGQLLISNDEVERLRVKVMIALFSSHGETTELKVEREGRIALHLWKFLCRSEGCNE